MYVQDNYQVELKFYILFSIQSLKGLICISKSEGNVSAKIKRRFSDSQIAIKLTKEHTLVLSTAILL